MSCTHSVECSRVRQRPNEARLGANALHVSIYNAAFSCHAYAFFMTTDVYPIEQWNIVMKVRKGPVLF